MIPRLREPIWRRSPDFFREFADQCHHGKEEDRLFVCMNRMAFPTSMDR